MIDKVPSNPNHLLSLFFHDIWLDSMILQVFSNLNSPMILEQYYPSSAAFGSQRAFPAGTTPLAAEIVCVSPGTAAQTRGINLRDWDVS